MQILYSYNGANGRLLSADNKTASGIINKVAEKFPATAANIPVIVSGVIRVDKLYAYKAKQMKDSLSDLPGAFYIHAFALEYGNDEDVWSQLAETVFYEPADIEYIASSGSDSEDVLPSPKTLSAVRSDKNSLRTAIYSLFSSKSFCMSLPAQVASSDISAQRIVDDLFRYVDKKTREKYTVFFNTAVGIGNENTLTLMSERSPDLPKGSVNYTFSDDQVEIGEFDQAIGYLLESDSRERREFISLLDKYGEFCEDMGAPVCVCVYDAFIGFDSELIYKITRDYYKRQIYMDHIEDLDAGIKTVLRQTVRDRAVIRDLYYLAGEVCFSELRVSARPLTMYYSLFRSTDGIFESDEVQMHNLELAAMLTEGMDDVEKAKAYKVELERLDDYLKSALNCFETGMILSYRNTILNLSGESEFLRDVKNRVLGAVSEFVVSCDKETLFANSTDLAINAICQKEGADRRDYNSDIEEIIQNRYREILSEEVETRYDTKGRPVLTLERLAADLPAGVNAESDSSEADDLAELRNSLAIIAGMTVDNYQEAYTRIFGERDKTGSDTDAYLLELFREKLSGLFDTYELFRAELIKKINGKESAIAKALTECRYSFAYCYAAESSDINDLPEIVKGYDPERVDPKLFLPILYNKVRGIARAFTSVIFIEDLIRKSQNDTLTALLLAAKLESSVDSDINSSKEDIKKLAGSYSIISDYIAGEICFDLVTDDETFAKIPLSIYADALDESKKDRVRSLADASAQINDFLAYMGVEGYEKIEPRSVIVGNAENAAGGSNDVAQEKGEDAENAEEKDSDKQPDIVDLFNRADEVDDQTENGDTGDDTVVVIEPDIPAKDRTKEASEAPAVLNILHKRQSGTRLKGGIIAMSIITVLAIAAFVITMLIMK